MKNVQESGLTEIENQLKQVKFDSCYLVNVEVAIDSIFLKQKNRINLLKELQLK